jgi:formamidopyrimidine-DNA glycosylase
VPELPEVETIVRELADRLPGATVRRVEILHGDLIEGGDPPSFKATLEGRTLGAVTRRAKNVVVAVDSGRLVVNLGMTGRLLLTAGRDEDPSHLGVRIGLDGDRELRYHDVRRFGRLRLMDAGEFARWDAALGVEPLGRAFSTGWLEEAAGRSRVPVKVWLMDQRRVVGVGNIYASEALFRARVDPRRPANTLSRQELARVRAGVRGVLRESIAFRGTTLLDYRDASGGEGGFAERLRVYDRAGEPCLRCGRAIERIVQGGRATFHCPRCQR